MIKFKFSSENLIFNLDKLGAWSSYTLCVEALQFYYKEYDEIQDIEKEIELINKLGCKDFHELIIKYHKEVGYKNFNSELINEF